MGFLCGFTNPGKVDVSDHLMDVMCQAQEFRGGTSTAHHLSEDILLCASEESVSNEKKLVFNESKTIIAACEGEIYNGKELQRHLKGQHTFRPQNVFELIPHLFEDHGKEFGRHLNGVFTLALWDTKQKALYLVRDHVGSHSLYYAILPNKIIFASTMRALLRSGLVAFDISMDAINSYFAATALSAPQTMLENVFRVKPGHMMIFENGKSEDHDYWLIKNITEDYSRKEEDFAAEIRERIEDSIKIRADYGGKYGALVSGGLDTGVIASTLSSIKDKPALNGFSIAFEEAFYSDAQLQDMLYRRYRMIPHRYILKPKEWAEILTKAVAFLGCPVNDVAAVGMYKSMEMARNDGCIALFDGEGADELFCTRHSHGERGIQKYLFLPYWQRRLLFGSIRNTLWPGDTFWAKASRLLCRIGMTDEERRLTWLPSFHNKARLKLLKPEVTAASQQDPYRIGKHYLAQTMLQDPLNIYHYGLIKVQLPRDLLFKNERMASAHGITNRTPWIDYRLVELALKIPSKFKMTRPAGDQDGTKLIYKKAVEGMVPDEVRTRIKARGFSQPSSVWYRRELKDFLHDNLFCQRDHPANLYINERYVRELFDAHMTGTSNMDYFLNAVLIFKLWMKEYMSG